MIFQTIGAFLLSFWHLLPRFGPLLMVSWGAVLAIELLAGARLRGHLRPHILRLDEFGRAWAIKHRFRVRGDAASERIGRSWFMRFWTNFASAPSLCVLSFLLALYGHARHAPNPALFYFPGLCYLGSMAHSYVSKRAIKRVRPHREEGAFGFKMRDGSFPSGHSLTSFCFWFPLAIVASVAGWGAPLVLLFWLIALLTVGFTGFSRVYMGVHFPSDVLGGFSMGAFWLLVSCFALLPMLRSAL